MSRLGFVFTVLAIACGPASAQESQSSAPIDVVKDLYAAFTRGDLDHINTLLSPDTIWTFHGPEHLIPYAGVYKGPAGVRAFFGQIGATIDVREIVQQQFVQEGDTVAVSGWERSVVRATGGEFTAHWVHVWRVRQGRITRFEEFTDSAAIASALEPSDPARGQAYYTTCAGCHGTAAQGNAAMHAPNLTVQGVPYLLSQLRHFAQDIRGGPQDFYGWQMNGRAKALPDDRAWRDVVAYIDSLPKSRSASTLRGDAVAGRSQYAACVSCHGERGEGKAEVTAPALAGLDDWYLLAQLNAYRSGLRGQHKEDPAGGQMRAASLTLKTDQAVRDVVAYIASLQ